MIQLPVRRCRACGHVGRVGSFLGAGRSTVGPRPLVCPRCGHDVGRFDPRLR